MSNIHITSLFLSQKFTNFLEIAKAIEDHRVDRCKKHSMANVIVMLVLGILSGANNVSSIQRFVDREAENFASVLDMPHGIPSRSTFSRILAIINPHDLSFWLSYWMQGDNENREADQISIDGKDDNANGFHCLRAFNADSGQVLAHEKIEHDSNEIPAMSGLLKKIDIKNKTVTADAMHCQRKTAREIANMGEDYAFVLKANQHQFYQDIKLYLDDIELNDALKGTFSKHESVEKSRNRIEKRTCITTDLSTQSMEKVAINKRY